MTLKVREIYTESIALLFCARISRSAKDERTKATASFCARTKMCRPFPLKFGGKATRSRHLCAALADAAVSLSLSLSHTHAVVVVIVVIAVHAKLASAWPISAFSREYNHGESGGGRHVPGDGFASKAQHTEQNTRDDDVSRPRGVVAIVVQREHFNWAARFVRVGGAFYVCAVLWENDAK